MVARLGRASVLVVTLLLGGSAAHAQATLQGELLADAVSGYVVIASYADAALGCDEALGALEVIEASGARTSWSLDVAADGPFLLLAWRDANGDGEARTPASSATLASWRRTPACW